MAYTTLTTVHPLTFTEIANTCDSCNMVQPTNSHLVKHGDEHNTFLATCFSCSSPYDVSDHCDAEMSRIADNAHTVRDCIESGKLYHQLREALVHAEHDITVHQERAIQGASSCLKHKEYTDPGFECVVCVEGGER
jgi:hypothetical protein